MVIPIRVTDPKGRSMLPVERQQRISDILAENGIVLVSRLAEQFGVSELTIRRDLDQMEENRLLKRTHGGATVLRNMNAEPDYLQKAAKFADEKRHIAQKAAQLVEDNDIVMVNSGTTASAVLKSIIESGRSVTIITNNVDVFNYPDVDGRCTIVLVGGTFRSRSRSLSGSLSNMNLDGIFANKSFIGVDGLSEESGLTTPIYEESVVSSMMVKHTSGKVYVITTHNKIGVTSNYRIARIGDVQGIITDKEGAEYLRAESSINAEIIEA